MKTSMDEKLCLWLEDFDNPEVDTHEQEDIWAEQIQLFNQEHKTEYRFNNAIRIYNAWKRKRFYEGIND